MTPWVCFQSQQVKKKVGPGSTQKNGGTCGPHKWPKVIGVTGVTRLIV